MIGGTNTETRTPAEMAGVPNSNQWLNGGKKDPYGAWRSSVARLLWEQEVPGSNPGAPTGFTGLVVLLIARRLHRRDGCWVAS